MKAKDLRGLNSEELLLKANALKKDLFDLNYQRKMGQVEKPARFRMLKRDIARILTVVNEKKLKNES